MILFQLQPGKKYNNLAIYDYRKKDMVFIHFFTSLHVPEQSIRPHAASIELKTFLK